MLQKEIDFQNSEFWNELCGTTLAVSIGISEVSFDNLRRFDQAYCDLYPYLSDYIFRENLDDKKVLEIGLGYGTLGKILAGKGCDYYGLDIAQGPVELMKYRLSNFEKFDIDKIQIGSALDIPHDKSSFDYVYSIGCLHHTGDLNRAISEVYRVLSPRGNAIIMLYNRRSYRQLVQVKLMRLKTLLLQNSQGNFKERVRKLYDTNKEGKVAPHTEYVSTEEVKVIFQNFSNIKIDKRNFDHFSLFGRPIIKRRHLLNNIGRILGLDLYITATK